MPASKTARARSVHHADGRPGSPHRSGTTLETLTTFTVADRTELHVGSVSPGRICNAWRVCAKVALSGVGDTFPVMRIGYGRVSTRDQHPEAQHDALAAADCEQIFIDLASAKLASRTGLDKALLSANRAGDQLVITKLDRLGLYLEHPIQLSRELEKRGARPRQVALARQMYDEREADGKRRYTVAQLAGRVRRHPPDHLPSPEQGHH